MNVFTDSWTIDRARPYLKDQRLHPRAPVCVFVLLPIADHRKPFSPLSSPVPSSVAVSISPTALFWRFLSTHCVHGREAVCMDVPNSQRSVSVQYQGRAAHRCMPTHEAIYSFVSFFFWVVCSKPCIGIVLYTLSHTLHTSFVS